MNICVPRACLTSGPGLPPFEDGHLLAEGEYFERRVGAAAQEDAGRGKECEYE